MSRQQRVPSGKLIDIDDDDDVGSDFEELNLLLENDDDRTATNQSSSAKSSPLATPSANKHVSTGTANEQPKQPEQVSFRDRFDDDNFDDHEHDVPTFDVSFSSATFANSNSKTKSPSKATVTGSRWSQSASVGGTVLNNPAFQSDFNADYLLWSKVTAQQKRLHSSSAYSLTSSIVNLISSGGGSKLDNSAILTGQTKSSKFSLDSLLTSKGGGGAEQKLLPPSSSSQTTTTQPPKMTSSSSSNSKYRPTEWSMSSLNSANSNSSVERVDRRTSAYGETQRLVDQGSATRLIVGDSHNDEEDYDSADGFGGFHRRSMINGGGDDEDMGGGKVNGSGGPCSNWSLYKGIFYSSLSSVFFSLSAVIVKYLKNIHPGQLAVCRFVGIFVLTIPLIVYHDLNPFGPPELRHLLVFRGLAGATSLFLRFVAFQNLPIADASVIIFSIPVFVSIFAWIFLKEPCGLFQSFTIIIAMVGLMMTTKLPFLFGGGDVPAAVPLMVSPSSSNAVHYNSRHLTAAVVANMTTTNTTAAVNQLLKTAVNASSTTTVATTTLVNGSKIASAGVGMTAAQQKVLKAIVQTPPPPSIVQQSSAAAAAAAAASAAKMSHFYGVLAAMSSLIFASAVFIFIRKAKGAHHAVIMFNFGWVAVIETTVITTLLEGFSLPATPFDWYLIVILGVFSFCGQLLLTRSLQLEQAGPVSVVRATTDIALAFLWQVVVFKETPDLWSIFGALLVSSCILLTSLRKWALSLPERSRLRERLFFLSL